MTPLAPTPPPPYYAVIFTSVRTEDDDEGYAQTAARMHELAACQPGFLGFESARHDVGISVSYWTSLEAIKAWRDNAEHREAQDRAPAWYRQFRVRVCLVEREYGA